MAREPDWGDLRKRLVGTALKRGMPPADADDIVQEAMYKILKRGSWTDETIETYLFRALRDKEAEYWRRRKTDERRVEQPNADESGSDPLESWTPPRPDASLELILTETAVREVLDDDAMAYAVLHAMGLSGRQIARKLGWPKRKVEAARIRLARKKKAVALAVLGQISDDIKGEVRDAH